MVLGTLKGIVVAIVLSLVGLMYLAYDPRYTSFAASRHECVPPALT